MEKYAMRTSFLILIFLTFVLNTRSQEDEPVKNIFQGVRFVNSQSSNLAEKWKLLLLVQHRFGDISGGGYEFFGLDQASMRLGFEYGFGDNLNFGIGRSTFMKTYDAFGKVRLLQQSSSTPLTLAVTVSGSVPTIRNVFPEAKNNFSDKISGELQLHLSKSMGNFGVLLTPGYISTGYLPTENNDFSFFMLGMGGSAKLSKKVSANVEYILRLKDNLPYQNPLSAAIEIDTGGHLFQLLISNSQHMFDKAILTNSTGDWGKGKLFLGFNLIREFKLKYY